MSEPVVTTWQNVSQAIRNSVVELFKASREIHVDAPACVAFFESIRDELTPAAYPR